MPPGVVTLTGYLRILQTRLAGLTNESPEAALADLLPDLIRSLSADCGRPGIDLRGQAYEHAIGRPDFSVKEGLLLIGHVETKAPGSGADVARFRGRHDRAQWERFKNLPNILYTDGTSFGLYRLGVAEGPTLSLSFAADDPHQEAEAAETARLIALLARFLSWKAVPPRSLPTLAQQLAPLCAVLRDEVRAQLDRPGSEVGKAATEFEDALFPGRTQDEIADAFAQVCVYSMLLARSNGAQTLDPASIEQALTLGHPVLARVVRVLLDAQTEQELGWALEPVRALIEVIDFDVLRRGQLLPGMTHHDQTWLYFYEEFLARYDPRLRDQHGVYYTPQQIIHAQVTLVDQLLRTRLGMGLGLAAPDVTVLDPAVGTGSYPIKVVEIAAATAASELGDAAVPGVVRDLAGRLYAFEILVGPYAVAHLRLAEVLEGHGAGIPGEAVNVLLTDTLTSPHASPAQLTRLLEPLVEEQRRAIDIKAQKPVLVCLGNPPYERGRADDDEGNWVVRGEGGGSVPAILDHFLAPARDAGRGGHLKNLYNDYVYFWRWALWKVFEQGDQGAFSDSPGIVSFITASSFLSGPGFVGMRERLRRACDEIWVIDLGGEGRGARREDNVFAIQTPVAITIALRRGEAAPDDPASVRYARVDGARSDKLATLAGVSAIEDLTWSECPTGWQMPFRPHAGAAWHGMAPVTAMFPWQHSGVQVKRTWPIAPEPEVLEARWAALLATSERARAFHETRDRKVTARPAPLSGSYRPAAIADLDEDAEPPRAVRYGYRPFDRQWLLADSRLADFPRPELWRSMSERQVFMVSFLTEIPGPGPAAVVTPYIPDLHHFRGSFGGRHVVPLYADAAGTINLRDGLQEHVAAALGVAVAPEDVFAYAYGLLASPRYVERFFEELRQPGPRVPLTADAGLFAEVVNTGRELIWLHTFGQRFTGDGRPRGAIPSGAARLTSPIAGEEHEMPSEFAYDATSQRLQVGQGIVQPVPRDVWDVTVSGWQVVNGWLRYRMRDGYGRARSSENPLDNIRPQKWSARYTTELLELLWVLETTIAGQPAQAKLVDAVIDGPLLAPLAC